MALVPCKECGNKISDAAEICPACGIRVERPQKKKEESIPGYVVFVVLFFVAWGLYAVGCSGNGAPPAESQSTPPGGGNHVLPSEAKHLHKGFPLCDTQDHLEQFGMAQVKKDVKGIEYMLGNSCTVTRDDEDISVLDAGFTQWVQVRVYRKGEAIEGFTYAEALAK